jgi:hypothetical protein
LPTLWFRNTWSWGRSGEGYGDRPHLHRRGNAEVVCEHPTLGAMRWAIGAGPDGAQPPLLFTQNESNLHRLWGSRNLSPYVKDAFHEYVVHDRRDAVDPTGTGTKAAAHYRLTVPAGGTVTLRLRLAAANEAPSSDGIGADFEALFAARRAEADAFYAEVLPDSTTPDERLVMRQGYAGLLWSKQYYHYVVGDWLRGDPSQPPPPASRWSGRNNDWQHLYNRDVISMPDKWEYPWYAAWDLGVPHAAVRRYRSRVRQIAARAVPARVVHASQRSAAGLRMDVQRRQSTGTRLGGVANLQDHRPERRPATGCSSSDASRSC